MTWPWLKTTHEVGSKLLLQADSPVWLKTLGQFPFLRQAHAADDERLRRLTQAFLARKEFTGAQGLVVTDAMAVAVAAQACLPLLHLAPSLGRQPARALAWYDDFVTVVLHPGEMVARRVMQDEAGVMHAYQEPLLGEAMDGGPVTLSWQAVASAGQDMPQGVNLVIHEFAHKLDMRDGVANGCPPMRRSDQRRWAAVMGAAFSGFSEQVIRAERFGEPAPWLDPYGASSASEFFAVACEAYFVNRQRFGEEHPDLLALFDPFFRPSPAPPGPR